MMNISSLFKGILLLLGIIAVFILLIWGGDRWSKSRKFDQQATALMQKIEYVQELKLVTFYYEEILTLGKRERVNKVFQRAQEELADLESDLYGAELEVARAESALEDATEAFFAVDTTMAEYRNHLRQARRIYEDFKEVSMGNIQNKMSQQPRRFGNQFYQAYESYMITDQAFQNASRLNRKQFKKDRDQAVDELKEVMKERKKILKNTRDKYLEEYDRQQKLQKDQTKVVKQAKKKAENSYDQAQRAYFKIMEEVNEQKEIRDRAKVELEKAQAVGEDVEPRLMVVVPVEISSYIDMSQLQMEAFGGPEETTKDSLLVTLPAPQLDSVLVDLDSTGNYNLGAKFQLLDLNDEGDGFYHELYLQLRDEIQEVKLHVKEKAIRSGILSETEEMAQAYVRDFASGMGYGVRFQNRIEPQQTTGPAADATGPAYDSTLEVLPEKELNQVISPDSVQGRGIGF
ncbi:MAG: DUF4230 domain-containing protein [Bacteroidota bacterium]